MIKIGDWVKLPHWMDYFEVSFITDKEIEIKGKYDYAKYSLNLGFIKKEEAMKIDMQKKHWLVNVHMPAAVRYP